jgi:hypothetical protein
MSRAPSASAALRLHLPVSRFVALGRARRLDGAFATARRTRQERHSRQNPTKPDQVNRAIQTKITDLRQKLALSTVASPVARS